MSKVIEANRKVHSALVESGEYQRSPHRSPESRRRLQEKIRRLGLPGGPEYAHLDVGCGDGFIFECVPEEWNRSGVDVTDAMLTECGKRHPKVRLRQGQAELLPIDSGSIDFITCYSFLDHLEDTARFFAEAMRVLKPGGHFYFGLSPNRDFFRQLQIAQDFDLSEELKALDLGVEAKKAFDDGAYYQEQFGIQASALRDCEPGKSRNMGLLPSEEIRKLQIAGAARTSVIYEWIFQQNRIDSATVKLIEAFLPFTAPCFKYFDLVGRKK